MFEDVAVPDVEAGMQTPVVPVQRNGTQAGA